MICEILTCLSLTFAPELKKAIYDIAETYRGEMTNGFNMPQLYEILFHGYCDDAYESTGISVMSTEGVLFYDVIKDDAQNHAITQLTGNCIMTHPNGKHQTNVAGEWRVGDWIAPKDCYQSTTRTGFQAIRLKEDKGDLVGIKGIGGIIYRRKDIYVNLFVIERAAGHKL